MRLPRFTLAGAFAVWTYLCVVAAGAAGIHRLLFVFPADNEMSALEHVVRLAVAAGLILVGVPVGGYFVHRLAQVHASRRWRATTAVVQSPISQRRTAWEMPETFGELRFHRVRFEFEVEGESYASQVWTTRSHDPGESVPLFFDPADPRRHCFHPGSDTLGGIWIALFMLLFGSSGLALLFV